MSLPSHIAPLQSTFPDLIQTHISYVLINTNEVLKFKKPVNFGFLNFEDINDRKKFCLAEIELNSRYSDGIYNDVIGVNAEGNIISDLTDSSIVDFAVRMNAFKQKDVLKTVIEKEGTLDAKILEELATNVAYAHVNNAPTSDYIQSFGTAAKIKEGFNNNLGLTTTLIGKTITQEQFDTLSNYFNSFIDDNKALLDKRSTDGLIKECHGDLHLANICIYKNKVVPFDCIEFNEDFRFIDQFYDIAFLLMDLEYRNEAKGSNIVMNKYLEITNDFDGVPLLNFYKAMRAVIRGNVTSLELNDPSISEAQKEKATKTAQEFFTLALSYLVKKKAKAYCTAGISGSGKSYLAKELGKINNAIIIRSDAVRKHICNVPLNEKSTSIYTDEISNQTYSTIAALGNLGLVNGFNIILDATFSNPKYRELVDATLSQKAQYISCAAPKTVLIERLNNRTNDVADADVKIMEQQLANWSDIDGATIVDTSKTIDYKSLV